MNLYTDGTDIVIATTLQGAKAVWEMAVGDLRKSDDGYFKLVPLGQEITLIFDMHGNVPDSGEIQIPPAALAKIENGQFQITATARQWAEAADKSIMLCYIGE